MEKYARFGYASRGVVYMVIGMLAMERALGLGGSTTDAHGALQHVFKQPFGRISLCLLGIGFGGHALWRFLQAILDLDHIGKGLKGGVQRIAYLLGGSLYAGLTFASIKLLIGSGGHSNSSAKWAAIVLSHPSGQWLLSMVALVVIGTSLSQFHTAYSVKFLNRFMLTEMSQKERQLATVAGRLGHMARGIVFGLIGFLLIHASLHYNAREVGGVGKGLLFLLQQPYGHWLLGGVAAGLITYGVYCLVLAWYRRIMA
jgi:hypothetical protein